VCVCVCVCVWERERERERKSVRDKYVKEKRKHNRKERNVWEKNTVKEKVNIYIYSFKYFYDWLIVEPERKFEELNV